MKIPQTNNTRGIQYGLADGRTVMINPGETVMVDAPPSKQMVTPPPPKAPPAPTGGGEMAELVKKPVSEIKPLLGALTVPELEQLLKLEREAVAPRKTLVEEIEANILAAKAK